MVDLTFEPDLVEPFYLNFMNANILALPVEEQASIAARFRETLPSYSDDLLVAMLRSSWRPAKVAAWVIAARHDQRFVPALTEWILRAPWHTEHLCIALAALATDEAAVGLVTYLCTLLPPTGAVGAHDESVSPDWAIAGLSFVDSQLGSHRAASFLATGGPWHRFIESRPLLSFGSNPAAIRDHWVTRLATAQSVLPDAVRFIESHLSGDVA